MAHNPVGIEISDMRRRLRAAIDQSRHAAVARRTELNEATEAYERFLTGLAEPLVQMLANAMRAEGYPLTVFTPRGGLRLASGRSGEDFIEFVLDTSARHPTVLLRVNRGRGRRVVQHERPIRGEERIDQLTEEDVLKALLEEIAPFVER
jgi:predicted membrane GTPase involved in stress response